MPFSNYLSSFLDRILCRFDQADEQARRIERQGCELMALSQTILALFQRLSASVSRIEDLIFSGGGAFDEVAASTSLTELANRLDAISSGGMGGGATIDITNATWVENRLALNSPGRFASYTHTAGDQVQILRGTNATPGFYGVVSKTSADEIVLARSIGGGADGRADIDATLLLNVPAPQSSVQWPMPPYPGQYPGQMPQGYPQFPGQFPAQPRGYTQAELQRMQAQGQFVPQGQYGSQFTAQGQYCGPQGQFGLQAQYDAQGRPLNVQAQFGTDQFGRQIRLR